MNTLNLFPRQLRETYENYLDIMGEKDHQIYHLKTLIISLAIAIIAAVLLWVFYKFYAALIIPFTIIIIIIAQIFYYFKISLQASYKVDRMEILFPDVLQLMASNLRAGMTMDNSLVLAARPEFAPLDEEIKKTGKEIATGRDIGSALIRMASRIGSDKIEKTSYLIISGLRSGGNIADLIEQTGRNMRSQEFSERRVTSGVLMYVIFIFFAVAIGSPLLFSLSAILVEILIKLLGGLSASAVSEATSSLPLMLSQINISSAFINYFVITFILATDFLASLVMGLVQKGEEKAGLRYLFPLIAISLGVFFLVKMLLGNFFSGAFAGIG